MNRLWMAISPVISAPLFPGAAIACATCGLSDPGYRWSTYFMMGAPFLALGLIGGMFFIARRL